MDLQEKTSIDGPHRSGLGSYTSNKNNPTSHENSVRFGSVRE